MSVESRDFKYLEPVPVQYANVYDYCTIVKLDRISSEGESGFLIRVDELLCYAVIVVCTLLSGTGTVEIALVFPNVGSGAVTCTSCRSPSSLPITAITRSLHLPVHHKYLQLVQVLCSPTSSLNW